ncbi:hypothetical protein ACPPVT_09895 [Angustibacter sp. McL0619]|uniref:hypothetical protein n=1 Tax=Angustibacter sp. McL0619 TaxID=3415676 RepID=UPI003CF28251
MAPTSQAQELVRDFSRLPDAPGPESWSTSVPASPPPPEQEPPLPPELYFAPAAF